MGNRDDNYPAADGVPPFRETFAELPIWLLVWLSAAAHLAYVLEAGQPFGAVASLALGVVLVVPLHWIAVARRRWRERRSPSSGHGTRRGYR